MRNRRTERSSGDVPFRLWAPARFRAAVSIAAATAAGLVPTVAVLPGPAHAAVVPSVSVSGAGDTAEGEAVRFELTLSEPADTDVTVQVSTTGGNGAATEGADYAGLSAVDVTIPQGQTSKIVEVMTLADGVDDSMEVVYLEIVDPGTATLGTGTASGMIVEPVFTVTPVGDIVEGDADRTQYFDISLNFTFRSAITLDYSITAGAGTATEGEDFEPVVDERLYFGPQEPSKRVAMTIHGNEVYRGADRSFAFSLTNLVGGTARGMQTRTFDIIDDEGVPEIASVTSAAVTEGASGSKTATFTVALTNATLDPVILNVSATGGTATNSPDTVGGLDFGAPATVTVPPGAETATFDVTVHGDDVFEVDETVPIVVSPPSGSQVVTGAAKSGTLTIANDDDMPTVAFDGFDLPESSGNVGVWFTVTGDAQAPLPWTGTLTGAADGGSDPAENDDFADGDLVRSGTLAPGADRIDMGTVNLDHGSTDEFDETVKATVELGDAAPVSGFATIRDFPSQQEPKLMVPPAVTVQEGSPVWIPVSLDFAANPNNTATTTEKPITVRYTVTPESAAQETDYAAASGTLTINPPAGSANIVINTLQDVIAEANETFTVTLSSADNAVADGSQTTTVTVSDVDTQPTPTVSIGDAAPVPEGRPLVFPLTLSNPKSTPITVRISTTGGTATPNADYGPLSEVEVTFAAGQTTATVEVPTNPDNLFEHENETVTARITDPGTANLGVKANAQGDIADPGLRIGTMTIDENANRTAAVDMVLSVPLDTRLQAWFELLVGSATTGAFTPISSGPLTYEPGQTSRQISGTLPAGFDVTAPGSMLKVRLNNVYTDSGLPVVGTGEHSTMLGAPVDPGAVPTVGIGSAGTVAEGRPLRFPLTLDRPSSSPVTVLVSTEPGTATPGADHAEAFGIPVTFQPGQVTATAEIMTNQDGIFEHDSETVHVRITNPGSAVLGSASSYGKIIDPALKIGTMSVDENASREAVVDMVLNVPLDTRLQAGYELLLGSASTNVFTPISSGTLTYEPGQTNRQISGPLPGDYNAGAPDRMLKVRLYNLFTDSGLPVMGTGEHSSVLGGSGDPGSVPTVRISEPGTALEGRPLRFPLTLDRPSSSPITVRISTGAGTATPGADYAEAFDMPVTFQPGQVTATADIMTNQDGFFEHDSETVNARITDPGSAALGSPPSSYGRIVDPVLKIGTMSIDENASRDAVVDLALNVALDTRLQAGYELSLGSASTGVFTPLSSGVLFYEPGQTSLQISAPLPFDFNAAAPGKMLKVRLYNLYTDNGLQVMGTGEHSAMIGGTGGTPTIASVTSLPQSEGDGSAQVTFTVQLSGPAAGPVTLDVSALDDSAVRWGSGPGSNDFSVPAEVFIPEGQTQGNFTVTVNGDGVFEPDEQAWITVTPRPGDPNVTGPMQQSMLKIYNDDAAPALTFGGFDLTEGAGGGLWFDVAGVTQNPLPWTATVRGASDGSSDPAEPNDFEGGALVLSGTLQPYATRIDLGSAGIPADSADEYDETIEASVEVGGQAPVTGYGLIRDSYSNMPPRLRVPDQTTVIEGEVADLPVELDFSSVPGNTATSTEKLVTVDHTTTGGTATAGTDFTGASGTLVFTPPSTSQAVTVATLADTTAENDETLSVNLSNPSNAELGGSPATVTIKGDNAADFQVQPDVTATEGQGSVAVTVSLARVAAGPVDFTISTGDDTARRGQTGPGGDDYGSPPPTLTIPQGQTSATVTVPIVDDQVYEETESAKITVALASGETDATGPAQSGVLTITDDDPAPTITLNSVNATEGGTVDVMATPSGVAEDPVGFQLGLTTGGPRNDPAESEDYIDSGAPAVLPGGSTGPVLLRSIPLAADTADELTESFTVTATSQGTPAATSVSAVYGILDDPNDLPPSAVVLPANVREELGYAEVPVALEFTGGNGATRTDQPVTVYFEVVPGTATSADIGTPAGNQLFFPPGQNYAVIRVPIENDRRREPDEAFEVRLVAVEPFGSSIARASSDVVIVDDDQNLPVPSFTVSGDVTAREGDSSATLTVTLSEPAQGDVDLVVEAQPGTATPDDYGPPAASLRIPEGSVSGSITVPIQQDTVYEGDETARIAVSLAAGELDAAGKVQEGRLFITDDDRAPTITLDPTAGTVDEGDTIELSGTVTGTAQRDFEISTAAAAGIAADGEDAGPDDFELDRVTVTVPGGTPAGARFRVGTIEFLDDAVDENTETATVSLAGGSRTFRINDDPDDTPPAVSITDASVGESAGTVRLNVSLQFTGGAVSTSRTVTVPWSTVDGTADAGKDYTRSAGTVTFTPQSETATISVPILPDTKDEADQTFTVRLGTPSPADARLAAAEAEVVLEDDDKPKPPTVTAPATSTGEGRITITGTAAPGTRVELLTAQGVSGGTFKVAATTTADDDGAYSFRPNFTKGYRVQVRAAGLTSPVRTIQVRQDVELAVASNAKGAATLTVTGDPGEPGQKVTIQRQVKGGWDEIEDGKLGTNGKFTTTVRSLKAGNHVFRAVISATPALGITAGTSPARSVRVK
ncbi:Calx-beta domain-containing protein [Actinoplanes sp. NPDC023801]|uniref:Calx-beta domain-containing protein n=1 Tax=Actinoplanes sp. NPDC023801 TaxID=3154595 RepID=UPI0033D563BE